MDTEFNAKSQLENQPVDTERGNTVTDVQIALPVDPMPSNTMIESVADSTTHEIRSILERPVILDDVNWSSLSPAASLRLSNSSYESTTAIPLKSWNFPQDIFNASPIFVEKLQHFQYFKSDVEIEIKVATNPFLAGALLLVYKPMEQLVTKMRGKGTDFLPSLTSFPNQKLVLGQSNSVKLVCPYANIYDMFDMGNLDNQFGTLQLYVLSPLEAPTETSVVVRAIARFVNPDYRVPTQIESNTAALDKLALNRLQKRGYKIAQAAVNPGVKAKDTGEVSVKGPVSKVAAGVSMVTDVLSDIPLVGKIASSVNWASRVVGNTAASLGWSKPVTIQPQQKCVVKPGHNYINTEGNDDSTTLALIPDNGIDGSGAIPEDKDEMNLRYILQRPNICTYQRVNSTQFQAGKLLFKWEVSPFVSSSYGESDAPETMYQGSFAYASSMATLWKGSIKFDMTVVKTQYHMGRFVVVFLPETPTGDVPETLGDLISTNYATIYDLSQVVDFQVTVPFISNTPWRNTYHATYDKEKQKWVPDATTTKTHIGCIGVYALNSLSANDTVTDAVHFYVSHSAGDDYELARPQMQLTSGWSHRVAQANHVKPVHKILKPNLEHKITRVAQTSATGSITQLPQEDILVKDHHPVQVTGSTTGEAFTSLRQLIKRAGKIGSLAQTMPLDNSTIGLRTRHFYENERTGRRAWLRDSMVNYVPPTPFYGASLLYRFQNGSSNLKVIPKAPASIAKSYVTFDNDQNDIAYATEEDEYGKNVFTQSQQMSNIFEVRSPYYNAVRCNIVATKQAPVLGDVRTHISVKNQAGYGTTSDASDMFESAGDDFSFFFLCGPPPVVDIRSMKFDTNVLPAEKEFAVDFSSVTTLSTGITQSVNYGKVEPITTNPALATNTNRFFGISGTDATFTVTYTDATTEVVSLASCSLGYFTSSVPSFYFPYDTTRTVDNAATLASIVALGTVNLTSNATSA